MDAEGSAMHGAIAEPITLKKVQGG